MMKCLLTSSYLLLSCIWLLTQAIARSDAAANVSGFRHIGDFTGVGRGSGSFRTFQESSYYASNNAAPWANANNDCKGIFGGNAGLVSIDSEDERNSLNLMLENYGHGITYWTSGIYDPSSLVWRWASNNDPLPAWSPWGNGYPSNPNAALRIAMRYENRYFAPWITLANTQLQRYICEVHDTSAVTTTPQSPTLPPPQNVSSTCGEVLTTESGQIRYISSKPHGPYEVCVWMMKAPTFATFTFNLSQVGFLAAKDQYLYLTVFQNSVYPGHTNVELIGKSVTTLQGDVAILTFTTARNAPIDGRNFIIDFTISQIGGRTAISQNSVQTIFHGLPSSSASFSYPIYNPTYDSNELTVLAFPPPDGVYDVSNYYNRFRVTVSGLECCCKDFVRVYQLNPYHSGLYNNYETCNGQTYSSQDAPMSVVVFMSDNSTVGKGFTIDYDWGYTN